MTNERIVQSRVLYVCTCMYSVWLLDTFFDLTLSTYILCLYVSLKKHEEYNVCTVLHVLMYLYKYIELDKKKIL